MSKTRFSHFILLRAVTFVLLLQGPGVVIYASQHRDAFFVSDFIVKGQVAFQSLDTLVPTRLKSLFLKSRDYGVAGDSQLCDYRVNGYIWDDKPYTYTEVEVFSIKNDRVFNVGVRVVKYNDTDVYAIADSLAIMLFNKIVFGLTKPVRIAISEFTMAGGAEIFQSLKLALPAMLETGLSVSSDVVLVEVSKDTLFNRILEGYRGRYKYDPLTTYKYGMIMLPNYLIRGTFWEHGGKVRIDVKCVNIETGEAIFGGGTILPIVDIESIRSKMGEFSTEILAGIMRDVNKEMARRTVAVIGITPVPETKDNIRYTRNIVREIARTLKIVNVSEVRIKDDPVKVDSFMKIPTDRWEMVSALKVNRLLLIQLQNYGDGKVVIEAEIFDSENPDSNYIPCIKYGSFRNISSLVTDITDDVLQKLRAKRDSTPSLDSAPQQVTIKRELRPYNFGVRYGMVITSSNGPLENQTNQSFDLFFSAPMPFLSNEHLRIGGLITWDWGNRTWENAFLGDEETSVHLLSSFLTFQYSHSPGERTNPYVGFGLGILLLRRIIHEGDNLLDAPGYPKFGIVGMLGSEFFGNRLFYMTFQTKMWRGFDKADADTVNSTIFKDGNLFGLDVNLGLGVKW